MFTSSLLVVTAVCVGSLTAGDQPVVTLSHGGKVRGRSITFQEEAVDLFLGVRFAEPPVNELRFQKPVEHKGWEGTVDATSPGSKCAQLEMVNVVGAEDCLFLDITIPGGVRPEARKAVMVYLHGGGYAFGAGSAMIGTPLAVSGDVIVITCNYRVGLLGFLSDGPGTGNYGLWDQRAALLWVKKNIAAFGGDPDLVTIFGESAGAGSSAAQIMGQHNDGLFKRAIQQSGTLYQMLASHKNKPYLIASSIKDQLQCDPAGTVFDCLSGKPMEELVGKVTLSFSINYWNPVSDYDFFSGEVEDYTSYKSSQRFDVMVGMNAQDGGIMFAVDTAQFLMVLRNQSAEAGLPKDFIEQYLDMRCAQWFAPLSPKLCSAFIINEYGLHETTDDKERARKMLEFLSEVFFLADVMNELEQHSQGGRATYGYYFTEHMKTGNMLWQIPDWLKTSADHADDLPLIFGAESLRKDANPLWAELMATDWFISGLMKAETKESHKQLSQTMMTLWTNFAKTGNPNKPVPLPKGTVEWPQFDGETRRFINLNGEKIEAISIPHQERVERLRSHLLASRRDQFNAVRPPPEEEARWQSAKQDDSVRRHDEL